MPFRATQGSTRVGEHSCGREGSCGLAPSMASVGRSGQGRVSRLRTGSFEQSQEVLEDRAVSSYLVLDHG